MSTTPMPSVGTIVRVRLPRRKLCEHKGVSDALDMHALTGECPRKITLVWAKRNLPELSHLPAMNITWDKEHGRPPRYYGVNGDYENGVTRDVLEKALGVLPRGDFHDARVMEIKNKNTFVVDFVFEDESSSKFYGTYPVAVPEYRHSWTHASVSSGKRAATETIADATPDSTKRPRGPAPEGNEAVSMVSLPTLPTLACVGETAAFDFFNVLDDPPVASLLPATFVELDHRWTVAIERRQAQPDTTDQEVASRMAKEIMVHVETHNEAPDAETQVTMRARIVEAVRQETADADNWSVAALQKWHGTCASVVQILTVGLPAFETALQLGGASHAAGHEEAAPKPVVNPGAPSKKAHAAKDDETRDRLPIIPCPCAPYEMLMVADVYEIMTLATASEGFQRAYPFPPDTGDLSDAEKAKYDAERDDPSPDTVVRVNASDEVFLTDRGWRVLGDFLVDEMVNTTQRKLRVLIAMGGGCVSEKALRSMLVILGVTKVTAQRALYPSVCRAQTILEDESLPEIVLSKDGCPRLNFLSRVDTHHVRAMRCKLFGTHFDTRLDLRPDRNMLSEFLNRMEAEEEDKEGEEDEQVADQDPVVTSDEAVEVEPDGEESETTEEAAAMAAGPSGKTAAPSTRTVQEVVTAVGKVLSLFADGMDKAALAKIAGDMLTLRLKTDLHTPVTTEEITAMKLSARHAEILKVKSHGVTFKQVSTLATAVALLPTLLTELTAAEASLEA